MERSTSLSPKKSLSPPLIESSKSLTKSIKDDDFNQIKNLENPIVMPSILPSTSNNNSKKLSKDFPSTSNVLVKHKYKYNKLKSKRRSLYIKEIIQHTKSLKSVDEDLCIIILIKFFNNNKFFSTRS